MIKLVFIGQHLNKTAITETLDACLRNTDCGGKTLR